MRVCECIAVKSQVGWIGGAGDGVMAGNIEDEGEMVG